MLQNQYDPTGAEAKAENQIALVFKRLDHRCEQLATQAEIIEGRVAILLYVEPPATGAGQISKNTERQSPILRTLCEHEDKLGAIMRRFQSIIDRIQT